MAGPRRSGGLRRGADAVRSGNGAFRGSSRGISRGVTRVARQWSLRSNSAASCNLETPRWPLQPARRISALFCWRSEGVTVDRSKESRESRRRGSRPRGFCRSVAR